MSYDVEQPKGVILEINDAKFAVSSVKDAVSNLNNKKSILYMRVGCQEK